MRSFPGFIFGKFKFSEFLRVSVSYDFLSGSFDSFMRWSHHFGMGKKTFLNLNRFFKCKANTFPKRSRIRSQTRNGRCVVFPDFLEKNFSRKLLLSSLNFATFLRLKLWLICLHNLGWPCVWICTRFPQIRVENLIDIYKITIANDCAQCILLYCQ